MSDGEPGQVGKSDTIRSTDSAGYQWEDIPVPTPPPSEFEHLIPPAKPGNADGPKQLCGYLMKLNAKLSIKTWRSKWFVFDEGRCSLYYYNEKNDFNPQGKIDISMATLSYDIENLHKHQFDILSEGRTTSLQATSSEAMMYWLDMLQTKRRKFSSKRNKEKEINQSTHAGLVGTTGSQENLLLPVNDDHTPTTAPPTDLEDQHAFDNVIESGAAKPDQFKIRQGSNKLKIHWKTKLKPLPSAVKKSFKINLPSTNEEVTKGQPENGCLLQEGSKPILTSLTSDQTGPPPQIRENKSGGLYRMRVFSRALGRPDPTPCSRCQQLQETINILESDLEMKGREVSDRDEINEFLRSEIRMGDMRTKVKEELCESHTTVDKKVDVLLQREQTIDQLQTLLAEAIVEKDRATTELEAKRAELRILGEQVSLYKEALTAKDHVVVELTNKLFKLEHKGQTPTNPQDAMLPMSTSSYEEELKRMQETVEAYKQQNRFLSSELAELNAVRTEDMALYRASENKHHELEAVYYRLQSKHMILLQESQQPRIGFEAGTDTEVVSQMLEEALQTEQASTTTDNSNSFDRYGFSHTHAAASDMGHLTNPLTVKARKLDQEAQRALDETGVSNKGRWEGLMSSGKELQQSAELKELIRKGIPRAHRSKVWKWMIMEKLGKDYVEGQYEAILQQHAGQTSIAVNQIELDLLRTLPTNKYYDSPDAQGIDKLRRILVAFSWLDQDVGYCQGLNRLGAIALLFLEEEVAFWCLVAIVHHLLPNDYYSKMLLGSQTDQRVLRDLLQEYSSKLYSHLSLCDIDLSLITFNWFHTIFVDNLPVETMLRIWDTFLYEGSKVLFRFAIAIFKYNEESVLSMNTSIGIFNRLRTMCQDATDVNKLANIAFNGIGRFSMRAISHKRAQYKLEIEAELQALDNVRSQVVIPISSTTHYQKLEVGKEVKENDSDGDIEETIYLD